MSNSNRYICIHGHFYQPPRENPWLEAIEVQDSAYPYHDWNERITAECYAPNASSRILDGEGHIVKIVNNYSRISFNFGATLLDWMADKEPRVYRAILQADIESRKRFSGHGSAIAQAYNHIILPLANSRDKKTQITWGIRDFRHRFGREPEGMWLAETAVDLESLELLADQGIRFTILAPHQAKRVRKLGGKGSWADVSDGRIDPSRAYEQKLPSGRSISLFFYDGPISRGVAFEGLLTRGENLANRLLGVFSNSPQWPQLVHIATDGETYGHHHRHGDMALAYALDYIESNGQARLTNYAEFLELNPPTHEVDILENTAWSCAHGVDRWRGDCGCNTGGNAGWNQMWRTGLRSSLDYLRDQTAEPYERLGKTLLHDPWGTREDYVEVVLNRTRESTQNFLARHSNHTLAPEERVTALKLLELQRHAMLMYTSCGWFFDELSGIETVQIIQYAARVIQLAHELFDIDLEPGFLRMMEKTESNIPEYGNGRVIYERFAKPAITDLPKVGAHFAMASLFEDYGESAEVYCYTVQQEDVHAETAGRAKVAVGRVHITSRITNESAPLSFGVLHFGDHNLIGGVRPYQGEESYQQMVQAVTSSFSRADFPETLRWLDKHFGPLIYSLKSLFHDEQRRILNVILDATLSEAAAVYRQVYENHTPLMRFLTDLGVPLPRALLTADEFILNHDLQEAFSADEPQLEKVYKLLEEARMWGVQLDHAGLGFALAASLERHAERFAAQPTEQLLKRFSSLVHLAEGLPFNVDFWKVQNIYYEVLQNTYPRFRSRAARGEKEAQQWSEQFSTLGKALSVMVE
jgi:alpha-amylase/alpha-mannosidase (GH57 family)